MSREDLEQYNALAAQLDRLIYAGKCDSPEAEAVRDQMDAPWYRMSDADLRGITPFSPLRRHKALTLKLHRLICDGKGETPGADAIREESDGPWREMTDEEREQAAKFSGDLDRLEARRHGE